jgi:hypothetical protein
MKVYKKSMARKKTKAEKSFSAFGLAGMTLQRTMLHFERRQFTCWLFRSAQVARYRA